MKKPELKKWQKVVLGAMSGVVVASSAIIPPAIMTSCSQAPIYVDELDRENNVSSATYNRMKDDFRSLYELQLDKTFTPPEIKEQKMAELNQDIQNLDEVFETRTDENSNTQIFDFTTMTTQLSNMAYEDYGIQLDRSSTATWQQLKDEYQSFRDSNEIYMHSIPLDYRIIQQVLTEADNKFDDIYTSLQDRFKNDALGGITYGRPQLLECFDSVNLDIAALAASDRLSDFLGKFTFSAKDDSSQANRYDRVESKLQVNHVIEKDMMQLLFNCIEAKTGKIWEYDPYTLIPGYYIEPVLHAKIPNPYENTYELAIDWSLINVNYLSSEFTDEERELVTGHVYSGNQNYNDPTKSIAEMLAESDRSYMNYSLYPTAAYESAQLKEAYFNPTASRGCINFTWQGGAANPENRYEEFFTGIKDKESTGTLSFDTLGNSGMLISNNTHSYEKVTDVIERVKTKKDVEPQQLTLVERFVRNCDVTSKVTLVNEDAHEVTNELRATYLNTVNKTAGHQLPKYNNNGYNVSPEFFIHANKAFDKVSRYVETYRTNQFEKAENQAEKFILTMVASSVQTVAYTAYYVFRMMFPLPGHGDPATNAMMIGLCVGETALLAAWIAFMTCMLYNPMKKLADNCDTVNKSAVYKEMIEKIDIDSEYFCPLDDDGNPIDRDLYKVRYQKFAQANFRDITRPMYQFYTTFNYQTMTKEFNALLKKYVIDAPSVGDIMFPWITVGGFCNLASLAWAGAQWVLEHFLVTILFHEILGQSLRLIISAVQFVLNQIIYGILWLIGNIMRWMITGRF